MRKQIAALLLLAVLLTGCAGEEIDHTEPKDTTEAVQNQNGAFPGLGGKMTEMTFNTTDGQTVKLSQLLKEKKLVVLNFWFENCSWCMKEFPVMEVAYHRFREDVEILALNPVDTPEDIRTFSQKSGLSFPMASCPPSWMVEMGIRGYPTSVFIDRDGVVCLIHSGAITDTEVFYTLFETFTADDYERKVYGSISELLG